METIRILFYTDFHSINEDPCADFGISELKKLILYKTRCFANFEIDLVNRHLDLKTNQEIHAVNKLTSDFIQPYDELWVFGYRQTNIPTTETSAGEPENELTDAEVNDLMAWMNARGNAGGVFISGDHANPDPTLSKDDPKKKDHATYLGLGRALGHRIPRAGKLRAWEGPPTAEEDVKDPGEPDKPIDERDNFNTQEGGDINRLDDLIFQKDQTAQHLSLVKRPRPHTIFWWYFDEKEKLPVPILKLPDHAHEGKLVIPETREAPEWPAALPKPEVIARGTDKRFDNRLYDLLVAYDGDSADVGRIVADSSWHHYLNINLRGFPREINGYPIEGSDLDQIAKFYGNLACWLAPMSKRDQIGANLFFQLAKHPQVLELKGCSVRALGRTARYVLESSIGFSTLHRLFGQSGFESSPLRMSGVINAVLLEVKDDPSLVGQESFLGTMIQGYHDDFDAAGISDPTGINQDTLESNRLAERVAEALKFRATSIAESILSSSVGPSEL